VKNIQIVDGADNATFSIFQATDDEFAQIFPGEGQDIEVIEDVALRLGDGALIELMSPIWERPIHKSDVIGIHGTLFYNHERKRHHLPATKREVDRIPSQINAAERELYARLRDQGPG